MDATAGESGASGDTSASGVIRRFSDAGGQDALDQLVEIIATRGPPLRELEPGTALTIDVRLNDLGRVRVIAQMLRYRIHQSEAAGDWHAVLRDVRAMRAIGLVSQSQNTLIERLVGVAIENMLHEEVRRLAEDTAFVGPEELAALAAIDFEPPRSTSSVLDAERLWSLGTLQDTMTRVRIYPLSYSAQVNGLNRYFDAAIRVANNEPGAEAEMDRVLRSVTRSWRYAPIDVLLPAVGKYLETEERVALERDRTSLVLAIERHRRATGSVPASLDEIESLPDAAEGFVYALQEYAPGYYVSHPDLPDDIPSTPAAPSAEPAPETGEGTDQSG